METFNVNRSQLMSRYEEALKKSQEETEREKREIVSLRDALYKSTPTPKKNESVSVGRTMHSLQIFLMIMDVMLFNFTLLFISRLKSDY